MFWYPQVFQKSNEKNRLNDYDTSGRHQKDISKLSDLCHNDKFIESIVLKTKVLKTKKASFLFIKVLIQ